MNYIRKQIIITATAVFIGSASFAQGEFDGSKTLSTQQAVTNFNNTSVTGFLNISGRSITSLEGLSELETVGGQLIISGSMISLTGLDNLVSVGENLSITDNLSLTSLSALTNLTSVGGFLNINNNAVLLSLEGLQGITSLLTVDIYRNSKLSNLNGLNNLESVAIFFQMHSNPELASIQSLNNLTSIGGVVSSSNYLTINSTKLTSLSGLENLTTLNGNLFIGVTSINTVTPDNTLLTNFCAISHLVTGTSPQVTTGEYNVVNNAYNPTHAQLGVATTCLNPTLTATLTLTTQTQIDDLPPHSNIDGDVTIKEANARTITSLSGLTNITSITGNLAILSNMALTSLGGLGNLTALGGELQIGTITGEDDSSMPNAALIDFCAISDLVSVTLPEITTTEYFVENNAYNPTYIGLRSGTVETATDTNDGCSEFGTAVVSTNTFSKEEEGYRLFPNPVSDVLFVKSESKITSITISNVSGQEVLKGNSGSIHVGGLSNGIYFARIVSGEKTVVEKFVKL